MCPNCYVHKPCADCARRAPGLHWSVSVSREDLYGQKEKSVIKNIKNVVLNECGEICHPRKVAWPSAEAPSEGVTFDDQKMAQDFATFLAGKYRDQGFHVMTLVGTAKTEQPPVRFIKAGKGRDRA